MEWISIENKLPPEDMDVLIWDGKYYEVSKLSWFEDGIPVFQGGSSSGNRLVKLWTFLPIQPERLNPEGVSNNASDSLNNANN